ncbi:hypothetical protein [Rhodococcus sp. KRD162]|uniref:hypothetical protein n=1 Tax=Rhodococcus sp. KRD162 TaxID=2729725 RepID=UPI0019D09E77|nr:hypothetical protein [Rhodococcus sp. KRD162]
MKRLDHPERFEQALAGRLPGEALSPYDRRVLVSTLVRRCMTDREISELTKWTDYTVVRIREHLGLEPVSAAPDVREETPANHIPCLLCNEITAVTAESARHGMCPDCAPVMAQTRASVRRHRVLAGIRARTG